MNGTVHLKDYSSNGCSHQHLHVRSLPLNDQNEVRDRTASLLNYPLAVLRIRCILILREGSAMQT